MRVLFDVIVRKSATCRICRWLFFLCLRRYTILYTFTWQTIRGTKCDTVEKIKSNNVYLWEWLIWVIKLIEYFHIGFHNIKNFLFFIFFSPNALSVGMNVIEMSNTIRPIPTNRILIDAYSVTRSGLGISIVEIMSWTWRVVVVPQSQRPPHPFKLSVAFAVPPKRDPWHLGTFRTANIEPKRPPAN